MGRLSVMSWLLAKLSVTVAFRLARLPPEAVASYAFVLPTCDTPEMVVVVPETPKSASFIFCTASSNVTRQVRMEKLVGELDGVWRMIDVTLGAVVSVLRLS